MPNTTYVSQLTEQMTRNNGSSGHEPPNPFACQLRNVDYTIDDARLGTCCPLDDDRYATQPSRSLEKLDELSLELLSEILLGPRYPDSNWLWTRKSTCNGRCKLLTSVSQNYRAMPRSSSSLADCRCLQLCPGYNRHRLDPTRRRLCPCAYAWTNGLLETMLWSPLRLVEWRVGWGWELRLW